MSVPSIIQDAILQEKFSKDGYLKIPLLSENEITELKSIYTSFYRETPAAFHSSSYLNDYEIKRKVSDQTKAIIGPALEKFLKEYRVIGSAFLSKAPGQNSEMPIHQDWTIVDEAKFLAVNVWLPLIDCDEHNGTIEVLKGSHRMFPVLRAPTIPFTLNGMQSELIPLCKPIPTKAGEAVILNQRVMHYSKPNLSEQPRVAITTGVVSKEAKLCLYYFDKENSLLEKYQQEEDFLLCFDDFHNDIFVRPKNGKKVNEEPYVLPNFTREEVATILKTENINFQKPEPVRSGFLSRIFSKTK